MGPVIGKLWSGVGLGQNPNNPKEQVCPTWSQMATVVPRAFQNMHKNIEKGPVQGPIRILGPIGPAWPYRALFRAPIGADNYRNSSVL